MRQTVSEANKYLRPTLKTVENGGRTTIGNDQPGAMHTIEVTSMDPEESVVPSGSGLSAGATLPTRHEINKRTIFGKFPVATKAEFDALSDAMKDKAVILTVDECPIGSEVKAIECNASGVPVDAHNWVMGLNGWKGGTASTLLPDGTIAMSGPVVAESFGTALGAPIRAAIDGPITISTFGDSTDTWWSGHTNPVYTGNNYTDRSVIPALIPASGTDTLQANRAVCGLLWHGHNIRFMGNGGIPGEATATIVARGGAAATLSRKSAQDVSATGARVCVVNGLSINDIQGLPEGSNNTAVDAMVAKCNELIRFHASRHELVIHTGIFGFNNTSFTAARVAMIRAMIIRSHAAMKVNAAKFRNVIWVDPVGLTCDETGAWLPGIADTGTGTHLHLSQYGAMIHSMRLREILDSRYDCKIAPSSIDTLYSWLNPSANRPAGIIAAAIGGATLGTLETAGGIFTCPFTTASESDGVQIISDGIKGWLAGAVSGDVFRICYDYEILDAQGVPLSSHQAQSDVRLTAAGAGTVDLQQPYCWVNGFRGLSTFAFSLDRDASALGASSTAWLLVKPMAVGAFTLRFYPTKIYKL